MVNGKEVIGRNGACVNGWRVSCHALAMHQQTMRYAGISRWRIPDTCQLFVQSRGAYIVESKFTRPMMLGLG